VERWSEPDAGIWEVRGQQRHFVHSKVMCWVALDCGIRLATDHGLDHVDVEAWSACREAIRAAIESDGMDPRNEYFVQHFGSTEVDASLLQLALVGFVEPTNPRMMKTVEVIQRQLAGPEGLLRRYRSNDTADTVDGSKEGYFLLCTCWLVQVLALQGRLDEARELFDRVVAVGNDVGLYAEEYQPSSREFLGNFPQAFTHLGLIAAANRIAACTAESAAD
ncbi:MAG: glycoside hydrolase family 15 protein, partial [Rhodococcus sp. (in: high G+C Gram-positive bacteria)]